MLSKITVLALTGAIQAADHTAKLYPTWTGGPKYLMKVSDRFPGELEIQTEVPENMWFTIGYAKGMDNADMVMFQAKNDFELSDLWSVDEDTWVAVDS